MRWSNPLVSFGTELLLVVLWLTNKRVRSDDLVKIANKLKAQQDKVAARQAGDKSGSESNEVAVRSTHKENSSSLHFVCLTIPCTATRTCYWDLVS